MGAPESVGHVTQKWWQTKKLFDWTYETPMPIHGPLLEKLGPPIASVSIEQRPSGREKEGVWFVARSRWFGSHNVGQVGADTLELLMKEVELAFHDKILAHTDTKWSDWIEVEIKGTDITEEREGVRINISWKILKRARFPDGRDMVMNGNSLNEFPKPKAAGKDVRDYGRRDYYQDSDAQFAYIPATPENLEAVRSLVAKLGEVNDRLLALLTQKSISQTVKLLVGDTLRLEGPKA